MTRNAADVATHVATAVCAAVSVLHLWLNLVALPPMLALAAIHFASLAVVLMFLPKPPQTLFEFVRRALMLGLPAAAAIVLWLREDDFYARGMKFDALEWVSVVIVILGAIEFARRSAPVAAGVIAVFLSYALYWGKFIDGPLGFPGLNLETVLFRSVYTDEGMFGSIAGISASFVFMFVLFGAFLMRSGAGEFVVDIARVASRRLVGGPGFVAIGASALTGTISGSAVANTVTTGIVTIPLMKRSGFRASFAAAVEATASTGGQLTPPVMGAGVFLIASYTQVPYAEIVTVSIIPALAFFLSLALSVRIEAKRAGLKGIPGEVAAEGDIGKDEWQIIRNRGASFLVPVGGLIALLASGFTPVYAAGIGICLVIGSSWLTRDKMGPTAIMEALAEGAKGGALTCLLLVSIGLVVNVIAMTGLGATFSLMIVEWANGYLLFALVLIAIASLVLGMGLPVTASYVVLATLSAPALAQIISADILVHNLATNSLPDAVRPILMLLDPQSAHLGKGEAVAHAFLAGLPAESRALLVDQLISPSQATAFLVAAHLAIFWLSQDSNVTPPVCLTVYAGAAIAKSPPFQTAMIAWKMAKPIYLLPVAFFTTPILDGTLEGALWGGAIAMSSLAMVSISIEGYFERPVPLPVRAVLMVCGLVCLLAGDLVWRDGAMTLGILALAYLAASGARKEWTLAETGANGN